MVELESSNSKDLSFYSNFGYNLYVGISVINNSGGNVYVFRNRLVNTRPMSTSETKIDTSYGYCIKLGKGWDAKVLYAEDVKFFNNSFFATGAPIWDARYKTLRRFEFINNIFSSGGWKTNFKNKDTLTHTFDNNCIWKNNLWVKEEGLHEPGIKVENSSTATFVNAFTINPYSNSNLNIKNSSKALNMGTNYHKKWNVDTTSISGNSFDIGANESDINSNDSIKMGTSATASFQGLTARYYSNDTSANFSVPVTITRIDTAVNFDWKLNSPDGAIKPDYFTVRWTGKIQAVLSEIYTFYSTSDDYVKLWVNGTKIIDNWASSDALPSNKLNSTNQAFVAGRKYDIVLEYREKNSNAICKLYWQSPNTPKQIIPSKYFSTSENNTFNYREGEDIFNYNNYFKESEQTISTYPNPAENEIFINITDKLLDNETIKIFNMLGESVLEYHLNDQDINNLITINCSNLPAGHYALHFKNYHKKIIKY